MKKLITKFLASLAMLITLTGCECDELAASGQKTLNNFEILCHHVVYYYIKDVDTDIIYIYYARPQEGASLCVYYNSEGHPMTYQEFQHVHVEKYH